MGFIIFKIMYNCHEKNDLPEVQVLKLYYLIETK